MLTVYLEKTGRKPKIPIAALIVGGVWFLFVLAGVFLHRRYNVPLNFCLFRRITGLPCPTCGATTGGLHILNGKILEGWLANPFVYTTIPVIGFHLIFQIITGYTIRYRYSVVGRKIAAVLLTAAIFVNWVYVIMKEFEIFQGVRGMW